MRNKRLRVGERAGYQLFAALCLYFTIPFLQMCVRANLLSQVEAGLQIAGHMEWFDLIDETLQAFLIIPLYSVFAEARALDGDGGTGNLRIRAKKSFSVALGIYTAISLQVMHGIVSIVNQAGATSNIAETATYLRLETVSFILGAGASLAAVYFTITGQAEKIVVITLFKCVGTIAGDIILVPKQGVNGVAMTNILINAALTVTMVVPLWESEQKNIAVKDDNEWFYRWAITGAFAGGQVLIDNIVYGKIVCRMVNEAAAQGNYWVSNNFIWGLLLVPTMAMSEMIKSHQIKHSVPLLMKKCVVIAAVWVASVPLWKPFFHLAFGLDVANANQVFAISLSMLPCYMAYNIGAVFSSIFISQGRTAYNGIASLIVNFGYYSLMYIFYRREVSTPGIGFVCALFGGGIIINAMVMAMLYQTAGGKENEKKKGLY